MGQLNSFSINGTTELTIIDFISYGTPGRDIKKELFFFICIPAAVPYWFSISNAFDGTKAWALFKSLIGLSTKFLKRFSIWTNNSWLCINLSLKNSQKTSFVISSFVGPSPPVVIIISNLSIELLNAFIISSLVSLIYKISQTSTPILINSFEIKVEFVSTIWPIKISSPIVIIFALIIT